MKKQNGFIATSLLYSFFLAFVTLFIGVVIIYLQNRVYLDKLEDSSKNAIYIREMKDKGTFRAKIKDEVHTSVSLKTGTDNVFIYSSKECNFSKCETIYYDGTNYVLEGCDSTC